MISPYLALTASLMAFTFSGIYALMSFALFFACALAYSFVKQPFSKPLSIIWIIVAAFFIWFMYGLLGLKNCILCSICVIAAGLFGRAGVKRSGDIMFVIGILFIVISLFFKGGPNVTTEAYFLPVSVFSGISCQAVSEKKPLCVLLSCLVGGIAGAAIYFGGGVFDEIYLYAALFTAGATQIAFVISGLGKA